MKITRVTVHRLDLPFREPYRLSGGRRLVTALDSTIIRVDTDAGIHGWGEGCPWGHQYIPASGPGVRAGLSLIAPAIIALDPRAIDRVGAAIDEALPGAHDAKSPIDMACWDILGRATGLPLHTLLGGWDGTPIRPNSSIATGEPAEMIERIERARAAGYRTHSAKIGGTDPDADIARIEAIEAARRPDEQITYDVNRAWTPSLAAEVMNACAARGWFEQPCETLDQCVQTRRLTRQPIMLDECMLDFDAHLVAWRERACEGVKAKPNRLGGITATRRVRDFGVAVGWRMHVEDLGGTALADTAAMHLAASTPSWNRLASWLAHAHHTVDVAPGQGARNVVDADGVGEIVLPAAPGIGVEPDPERLGAPIAVYEA